MTAVHKLKTWPEPFEAMWQGRKRFELRKNDRDFKVGDVLLLLEWHPGIERYTERWMQAVILYILSGPDFGLPEDLCVLSITDPVKWP